MSGDRIIYNGVTMTPDWPERIRAAQEITTATVAGVTFARIRFGEESATGERIAARAMTAVS
jgi:hypothetical protein